MQAIEIITIIACILIVGLVVGNHLYKKYYKKVPTGECACCAKKMKRAVKKIKKIKLED